jgi:hypothetical protein
VTTLATEITFYDKRWPRGAKSLTLIEQSKTLARLETMMQRLSP